MSRDLLALCVLPRSLPSSSTNSSLSTPRGVVSSSRLCKALRMVTMRLNIVACAVLGTSKLRALYRASWARERLPPHASTRDRATAVTLATRRPAQRQRNDTWARTGFDQPAEPAPELTAHQRSPAPDERARARPDPSEHHLGDANHTRAGRRRRGRLEIYLPHYSSLSGVQVRNRAFSTACLAAHNPMPTTGKMTRDTVPTFS